MPEYDYRCLKCGKTFSVTETMGQHSSVKHTCPACNSVRLEQVVAAFFAKTSKKS